jgi:hypothetical protein
MKVGWSYNFGFHNIKLGDTLNSLLSTFLIQSNIIKNHVHVRLFNSSWLNIHVSMKN